MNQRGIKQEDKKIVEKLYAEGHGAPYIAKKLGYKTGKISYYINRYVGARSNREAALKYHCNEKYFSKIDTEEKAYWLGFIYADGYVQHNQYSKYFGIALGIQDIGHLEKLKKCIDADHPIKVYQPSESSTNYSTNQYCRLHITSNLLYDDLVAYGVVEHKTNIVKAPVISTKMIPHFIRGYLDGDGCITTYTKKNHKTTTSGIHREYAVKILGTKELLDFIKSYIEQNNFAKIGRYYAKRKGETVKSLELSGNSQVHAFLKSIYENSTIYLDRKYQRYRDLCNLLHSRALRKRKA